METHLTKKTLTVSRGHKYTYYTSVPSKASKPTILLLHGWPDDASCWSEVLDAAIVPVAYGVIAPDCLGSGETAMPLDEREYDFRGMAEDLLEILHVEGVQNVVIWAHDWVSIFLLESLE
jgi:soluble epoxide hydrolase/lipid-phosphate phosphatase